METIHNCSQLTITSLLPSILESLVDAEMEDTEHLVLQDDCIPLLLPLFLDYGEVSEPDKVQRLWASIDKAVEVADKIFLI